MKLSAKLVTIIVVAIIGVGAVIGVLTGVVAFGHAELLESNVKNGQVLALRDVPARIQLKFSEHLDKKRSAIYVIRIGANAIVDQGDLSVAAENMAISVKDLKPGIYQIRWIAVAEEDAGFTDGAITFSVKE